MRKKEGENLNWGIGKASEAIINGSIGKLQR
jgi:hypothetical protein